MAKSTHLSARSTAMPEGPAANKITPKRWEVFIHGIANGTRKDVVLRNIDVTDQTFQAYLISKPDMANQYREAKMSWLRRKWPLDLIEDMLEDIAMGAMVKRTCKDHKIKVEDFYRIITFDPMVREWYDEARKIAVEAMADECLEIIDDLNLKEEDTAPFNSALVNLAKARISARQWHMSKFHFRKFGDRSKQEVETKLTVDHAETLDKARKRKESAFNKKKEILKRVKDRKQDQEDNLTVH